MTNPADKGISGTPGELTSDNIGIILLAAGSSSRMGKSKQLLLLHDEPLLLRSVKSALGLGLDKMVVVLGFNEQEHRKVIKDLAVNILVNAGWQRGMGNSIKAGLHYLLEIAPETIAVILMTCDQPELNTDHLRELIRKFRQTNNRIVASHYGNTYGIPALFERSLFPRILGLDDEKGAKKIIRQNADSMVGVNFPGGEIDLDTMKEYQEYLKRQSSK